MRVIFALALTLLITAQGDGSCGGFASEAEVLSSKHSADHLTDECLN
jgi:hypothetical protein